MITEERTFISNSEWAKFTKNGFLVPKEFSVSFTIPFRTQGYRDGECALIASWNLLASCNLKFNWDKWRNKIFKDKQIFHNNIPSLISDHIGVGKAFLPNKILYGTKLSDSLQLKISKK